MKQTTLGLYLSSDSAQAVVLGVSGAGLQLQAVDEWPSRLFEYAGDDTPGVDEFVEHLTTLLSRVADPPSHASVALDSSLLFVNTIPAAATATRNEITEQVNWELQQYFPDIPRGAFISDIHVLSRAQESADYVITVSVRRDRVQRLHRALGQLKFPIEIVDLDHFSADTSVRQNYPDTGSKFIGLFGVKPLRVDVSWIRCNDLESYTCLPARTPDQQCEAILKASTQMKGVSQLMLYGQGLTLEIIGRVRRGSSLPVEVINPFRAIDIATSARGHGDHLQHPYKFAAAVGIALRRD